MGEVFTTDDWKIGLSSRFLIEIENEVTGVFTECSGLEATLAVDTWEEGGANTYVHQFPSRMSYGNLTLKKAVFASASLQEWLFRVSRGQRDRQPISIILYAPDQSEARRWDFDRAFPIKWSGPTLSADSSDAAIESIEFVHAGLIPPS